MPSTFHDGDLQESVPVTRLLGQVSRSNSALAAKHLLIGLLQTPAARAAGSWGLTTNFLTGRAAAEENEAVSALVISWAWFYFPLPQASGCFDAFYLLEELQGSFPMLCLRACFVSLRFSH